MGTLLGKDDDTVREGFEAVAMPHLDAAFNLARWLTGNEHDANDLVQEAFLRAFRFFPGFRGGEPRAWLLTIVRNTFYTAQRDNRARRNDVSYDATLHDTQAEGRADSDPAGIVGSSDTAHTINHALAQLPATYREVLVLKEMDDLSYKEIALVAGIPIGTVMSRLARARKALLDYLQRVPAGE